MEIHDFIIRLLLSMVLGSIIGLERQVTGHPVGIRTLALVCIGSTMFVLFPVCIGSEDVPRIAAQVVTGVGFLGSGIIFKEGANVKGINTAATIWCSAAVGVLSGIGNHSFAVVAALLVVSGNMIIRPIADKIGTWPLLDESGNTYRISVVCQKKQEFAIRLQLMNETTSHRFYLTNLSSEDLPDKKVCIEAIYYCNGKRRDDLVEKISCIVGSNTGVTSISWELQ